MSVPTQETDMPIRLSYRQIADDIEMRIRTGEYPPGAALPSYTALADLYSVSPSTAARAYGLLHDRHLVVGAAGRGVFVVDEVPPASVSP